MEADFRACLERGVSLFNRQDFFEAHEAWEDAWRAQAGEPARFLQGLIQVAAGFVKLQRGAPRGMAALLERGAQKLEPFSPEAYGLNLEDLLRSVKRWEAAARSLTAGGTTDIDASALPRLTLRSHSDPPRTD